MPRNVRNFWIRANIDGRAGALEGGPRSKDGGFDLTIQAHIDGEPREALTILGRVDPMTGSIILHIDRAEGITLLAEHDRRITLQARRDVPAARKAAK